MKSGTSIGANVEESIGAQSKKDLIAKIYIAHKEARETKYWIELLKESGYIDSNSGSSIGKDCEEICKILAKIQITCNKRRDLK